MNDETFTCSFCGRTFPSEQELKNHVTLVHSNVTKVSKLGGITVSDNVKTGLMILGGFALVALIAKFARRKA